MDIVFVGWNLSSVTGLGAHYPDFMVVYSVGLINIAVGYDAISPQVN